MLVNLWVREKYNKHIHQVGTNDHDCLIFWNGKVEYLNMQNNCGTADAYEFIEAPDMDEYIALNPDEFIINKQELTKKVKRLILKKNIKKSLHKAFTEIFSWRYI